MWWNSTDEYLVTTNYGRKQILDEGKSKGKRIAESDYPLAVVQGQSLTQLAERMFQDWHTTGVKWLESAIKLAIEDNERKKQMRFSNSAYYQKELEAWNPQQLNEAKRLARWNAQLDEAKRLYISAFIPSYMEKVAELAEEDKKRGKQPRYIPATNSTGATVTVTNEKHNGDIHSYWLRLADPRHFDEAYDAPEPLTFDFSEAPASDTSIAASSSSYGAIAASDPLIPLPEYRSKTPRKKKPRIYWGKK
jgi:hypothetical protein